MKQLWRLRELSENNKRKIFKALMIPRITYPDVSLHCMRESSIKILQRIQNQGARYITNTRRIDRKRNEVVNIQA